MKRRDLFLLPAVAVGVMALNIAISIAVVWVYSTFVEPGRSLADYEAFAMRAAPVSSVIAGIPLMLLAGYYLARGRSGATGLSAAGAMAMIYIIVDAALLLAAGAGSGTWGLEALSYSTKLLSALAGAKVQASRSPGAA